MDKIGSIVHRLSDSAEAMRKSKYVQSDIYNMYTEMERELKKGRTILFSGTPCQCQAMKEYFSEYENQILFVALICRGVQSPKLWEEYLYYLGKGHPVTSYDFRDKSCCDDGHMVAYEINNKQHRVPMNTDRFSRLYIKCLTLRPSCYSCQFTRMNLPFDFTIGDFWGVEKVHQELADGKGTSLVIARSRKAEKIIEKIRENAEVFSCKREECVQPALQTPAKETILRKLLFKDFAVIKEDGHCDMELLLKKYGA